MIVEQRAGQIVVLAPAKLNLYLEILRKRGDGYHEIESLMAPTDLCDRLAMHENRDGSIQLSCDDPAVPVGTDNLVVRAAELLRSHCNTSGGARITLEKRIPMQAGLGGGSSDAAAALVGLSRLWRLDLGHADLSALAAQLGSDVPFFLSDRAAVCRGRGERIDPIADAPTRHLVLVCPAFGVRTADVYARVVVPEVPRSITSCLEAFCNHDTKTLGRALFNRLQDVAEGFAPDLTKVRETLTSLGPLIDGHLMSGSGSAYFGLCRDKQAAEVAARQLESLGQGRVRVVTCGP